MLSFCWSEVYKRIESPKGVESYIVCILKPLEPIETKLGSNVFLIVLYKDLFLFPFSFFDGKSTTEKKLPIGAK